MDYHVNGRLVPADEASVGVRDRGFRYGDAAVETLRVYGGTPFEWEAHHERLHRTARTLGFGEAVPDDLRQRIDETLEANDLDEASVRLSVTRGIQRDGLTPSPDIDPTVVVVVDELPRGGVDGGRSWDGPATVQTVRTRHISNTNVPSDIRTHGGLNELLGRIELRRATTDEHRPDECLLRNENDIVVEGATSNPFFVTETGLKTPAADLDLLPGITRSVVLELASDEDLPVETGHYTCDAVRRANEGFLTSTTREIRPMGTVDGIDVGTGPMTKLLQRLFDERVEREHY